MRSIRPCARGLAVLVSLAGCNPSTDSGPAYALSEGTDAATESDTTTAADASAGVGDTAVLDHVRRAYFVSAYDSSTGSSAANHDAMVYAANMWGAYGGYVEVDAGESGCAGGAPWCLHMTVVNARPHDMYDSSVIDYYDFEGRPVVTEYFDLVATEAGLLP